MMRVRALIVGLLMLGSSGAMAQTGCQGQPFSGGVCGNNAATAGLPTWATLTSLIDTNFGNPSVQGTVLNRRASVWTSTPTLILGKNGGVAGSVTLNGSTSGSAVIGVNAAAGTTTFNLPVGNGTNGFALTTDGSGNTSWTNPSAGGTVTSVALALPGIFTVSGSPVTISGTLTGTLATQAANLVWAGPTTGAAAAPTFRSLVGADLPNPSASTLGGVESFAAVGSQWIRQISTSGVPTASQPAFTDISGVASAAQLPNPTASTLGGVESLASVASKWINQISTSGVPSATQPAFSDLSGTISQSQLPNIGNNSILSNISGGSATPLGNSLSAIIDSAIANVQGDILYRNASIWTVLAPGTAGQVLSTGGAAANPSWTTVSGTGTVTSVASGTGLTGGPITSSGTLSFANIANGTVLANTSGGSAVPSANAPSSVLDVIGSTQGNILYRGASVWTALAPGTNGQFLQTTGAGSTPQWAAAVNSMNQQTGSLVQWPFPEGRLTLTSGTPVMTAGVAGATTVYYTSYAGKNVPIYNGTAVGVYQICAANTTGACELSSALGSNWATNSNYDWFIALNSGSPALCSGPAWTSDTARGSGAGTTQLQQIDGINSNAVTMTCRLNNTTTISVSANQATYVGTMRTGSAGQTNFVYGAASSGGTAALIGIWNAYNRVNQQTTISDTTSSWTYAVANTWRAPNGNATMRATFIRGQNDDTITGTYYANGTPGASTNIASGVGVDSTTAFCGTNNITFTITGAVPMVSQCASNPGIGLHFMSALEFNNTTTASTWYGTLGVAYLQTGLQVSFSY